MKYEEIIKPTFYCNRSVLFEYKEEKRHFKTGEIISKEEYNYLTSDQRKHFKTVVDKAEITSENKAMFFNEYFGQKVLHTGFKLKHLDEYYDGIDPEYHLHLKSLLLLTDEEVTTIGILAGKTWVTGIKRTEADIEISCGGLSEGEKRKVKIYLNSGEIGLFITKKGGSFGYSSGFRECDNFLCARGYAVQWRNIPIRELKKAGWIKVLDEKPVAVNRE